MINRGYLEYDVVEHCTLRCDGCTHFSPYMAPAFAKIDEYERDINALSKVMHTKGFRLLGGEPLLHKNLHEFIKIAQKSGIADIVAICTNGQLIDKITDGMYADLDHIEVSEYPGVDIDYAHVDEVLTAKSKEFGFVYNKSFKGKFYTVNVDEEITDQVKVQWIYDTCKIAHSFGCHSFKDGRYYKCIKPYYQNKYFDRVGIKNNTDFKMADGVDLHQDNLLEKLQAYLSSKEPLKACSFCLGTTDRKKSLPSRQLSQQEIKNRILDKTKKLDKN